MTEDKAVPRRALPPEAPDAGADAPSAQEWSQHTPQRGRRFAAAPESPTDGAGQDSSDPFFLADSATPVPPPSRAALRTPIPPASAPPSPVLPASDHWAEPGRRFSADDLPDSWTPAAPRRSAASPTPFSDEGVEPPSPTTTVLPSIGNATRALGPPPKRPWHVRLLWPVIAIAVVAAIALAWSLWGRMIAPPSPPATAASRTSLLIEPVDAAGLGGGTWTATTDLTPDENTGIRCILPSSQLGTPPVNGTVVRRTLTAAEGSSATLVQQQESYVDAASAALAFQTRSAQLGGCPGTSDLVSAGYAATGLGDEAVGVRVVLQDSSATPHDLLVVRTGSAITIVDAQSGAEPPTMQTLATAALPSLQRLCGSNAGTCPTVPTVTDGTLPPGEPVGFLTSGDLPLVTTGKGMWVGADMRPMKLAGSACEGMDLADIPKTSSAGQRSFVLADDSNASSHFGLDEAIYTFSTPAAAKALGDKLTSNVSGCGTRQATATVKSVGKLKSPDKGQLFTVDQRMTVDKSARSRVFVAVTGKHVIYLAANPTDKFDLSDAEWLDVGQRSVNRAKQLP